jgi:hypothetical protein
VPEKKVQLAGLARAAADLGWHQAGQLFGNGLFPAIQSVLLPHESGRW